MCSVFKADMNSTAINCTFVICCQRNFPQQLLLHCIRVPFLANQNYCEKNVVFRHRRYHSDGLFLIILPPKKPNMNERVMTQIDK